MLFFQKQNKLVSAEVITRYDGKSLELWDICGIKWTSWGLMKLNNADLGLQLCNAHIAQPGIYFVCENVTNIKKKRIHWAFCFSLSKTQKNLTMHSDNSQQINLIQIHPQIITHTFCNYHWHHCINIFLMQKHFHSNNHSLDFNDWKWTDSASPKALWEEDSVWYSAVSAV